MAADQPRHIPATDALCWNPTSISGWHRLVALIAFVALYGGLSVMGNGLREDLRQPTIMWPSCGLLLGP